MCNFSRCLILLIFIGVTASGPFAYAGPARPTKAAKLIVPVDSVFGTYFQEFLKHYGSQYGSYTKAFEGFCRRLRTSDLLADRLNMIGLSAGDLQASLKALEQASRGTDAQVVRSHVLAIDFALETLEGSITQNHRAEFRREVLADIPPITSTG
ncbi:MAG: hypothetical protein HY543_09575 [Deltaproteobacteria bacterium]|nr:hypothetical protein [Deltaproteobacteria bacterium]